MICKLCGAQATEIFQKLVLGKHQVKYYRCGTCLFTQTEQPFWLDEAYSKAITALDLGLVYRNLYLSPIVQSIIGRYFNREARFLDFGGGYGLFVRIMRDAGLDFYRQDKYCENLFASNFDLSDITVSAPFEALTAFELFEHLDSPLQGVEEMLGYSKSIIFSTDLAADGDLSSWDYLVPEVGQHIALYHRKSLEVIAAKFRLNLYSNGRNIHMLTPKKLNEMVFRTVVHPRVAKLYSRYSGTHRSLLPPDYEAAKRKLKDRQ